MRPPSDGGLKNENLQSEKVKYNADFNAMELKYVDIIEWCEEMSFKKSETSETIQKGKPENIKSKADNNALKILIDL